MLTHLAGAVAPLVVVAAVAVAASPQAEPARAPLFGVVKNAQRRAWEGATVHLLARPVGEFDDLGIEDRLVVTTDARGQFRAAGREGWIYTVWAVASAADGASYRVTGTVGQAVCGRPVELNELAEPRPSGAFAITGLDAWRDRAPFRCRFVTATTNVWVEEAAIGADGSTTRPPLPVGRQTIEILDKDGVPLYTARLTAAAMTVEVPPPETVTLTVRSGFEGAPIAGAEVLRRVRHRDHPIGRTDANGRLEVRHPAGESPYRFRVEAPGHARGYPGKVEERWDCDLEPLRGPGSAVLTFADGKPAAGLTLRVFADSKRQTGKTSGATFQDLMLRRTDAEGRVPLRTDTEVMLHAVLTPELAARIAGDVTVHPLVFVADGRARQEYTFGDRVPVRLHVRRVDGTPAFGAEILAGRKPETNPSWHQPSWVTDRRGDVVILAPAVTGLGLLVRGGDEFAVRWLDVGPRPADRAAAPIRVEVPLTAPFRIRGRVAAADGAELERTGVFCSATQSGYLGPALATKAQRPLAAGEARLSDVADEDVLWRFVGLAQSHRDRFRARGPEFEYAVPAIPWRYFFNAFEIRGKRGLQTEVEVREAAAPELLFELK